jgi:hypothetical protein
VDDRIKYLVISPAKDESGYIRHTIRSVIQQSVRPVKWVIVDDGSVDGTADIVERNAKACPWIQLMRTGRSAGRDLGCAEVLAFNLAYEASKDMEYEFIVKLDCDVKLETHYFKTILNRMVSRKDLGIASGRYLEICRGQWRPVPMPDYHAAGASKVVRRTCFEEIGGFVPKKGWDTLDEIRAQMRGWQTTHFKDVEFLHLKPEGSAMGRVQSFAFLGEIYYLTGGGFVFFLLKVIHKCFCSRPMFAGALKMLVGYLRARTSGQERLVTESEAKFYRNMLVGRIFSSVGLQRRR